MRRLVNQRPVWIRTTNLDEQQQIALVRIAVCKCEIEYVHRFLGLIPSGLCESLGNITHGRRLSFDRLDAWISGHMYPTKWKKFTSLAFSYAELQSPKCAYTREL